MGMGVDYRMMKDFIFALHYERLYLHDSAAEIALAFSFALLLLVILGLFICELT